MADVSIIDIAKVVGSVVTIFGFIGSIFGVYFKLKGQVENMVKAKSEENEKINTLKFESIEKELTNNKEEIDRCVDKSITLDAELRNPTTGVYSIVQSHESKITALGDRISRFEK